MESSSAADFEETRCEVFGITTDQGAEKNLHEQSVNVVPSLRGRYTSQQSKSWLWPNALYICGHLHVLYNALEEASKGISGSTSLFFRLLPICVPSYPTTAFDTNSSVSVVQVRHANQGLNISRLTI